MATLTLRREDGRIVCERVRRRRPRAPAHARASRPEVPAPGRGHGAPPRLEHPHALHALPDRRRLPRRRSGRHRVEHEVGPWRTVSCRGAREVVELAAGECDRRGLEVGDRVAWASRSAADARAERANGTFDDDVDEPRARILVASRDPRFLQARALPARRSRPRGRGADDAGAALRRRSSSRRSTSPCSTAPTRSPTRCAPRTRRARVDRRSRSSSPPTRAARARPGSASSTAGTRPRSCSSTSSDGSRSASRERPRQGGETCRGGRRVAFVRELTKMRR